MVVIILISKNHRISLLHLLGGCNMRKCLSIALAFVMLFTFAFNQVAFAAEVVSASEITSDTISEEIQPRNFLSGYNNHWFNSGDNYYGHFYVDVTGVTLPTGQLTLSIENFASNVLVKVDVCGPDGKKVFDTFDTSAHYISMANSGDWHNIRFAPGKPGRYTVTYFVYTTDDTTPSSGRINCWIY